MMKTEVGMTQFFFILFIAQLGLLDVLFNKEDAAKNFKLDASESYE